MADATALLMMDKHATSGFDFETTFSIAWQLIQSVPEEPCPHFKMQRLPATLHETCLDVFCVKMDDCEPIRLHEVVAQELERQRLGRNESDLAVSAVASNSKIDLGLNAHAPVLSVFEIHPKP
jgi:hypothetical protein